VVFIPWSEKGEKVVRILDLNNMKINAEFDRIGCEFYVSPDKKGDSPLPHQDRLPSYFENEKTWECLMLRCMYKTKQQLAFK
jgi:hypothetical protein